MDASASNHPRANDVFATYPDVDAARAAITLLERHGIEGSHIELEVPGEDERPVTEEAQREADMQATGEVGKRAGVGLAGGAVIGAILGAALGAAVSAIFDIYDPLPLAIGAALALGAFGAYAGGFYGGATGLPTSDAWGETFDAEQHTAAAPPVLAVHAADGDEVGRVVDALRGSGALRLRKADADGRLIDA